jgi:hypothetical protein
MMQKIRRIWQRLFPESLQREMAAAMLAGFAAQVKGF